MVQDLRFALRRVGGSPGFSLGVVLILAAGVAAAATMASVLNAIAIRPLDLPAPESLVAVYSVDQRGLARNTVLPAIDRLRSADLAADGWCGYNSTIDATESSGRLRESHGELVAGDCTRVIGIAPALGRWFTPEEAPLTGPGKPVIVITDRYWESMFDRSPDAIGRTVRILDATLTVIGIMPANYTGFSNDLKSDFIVPFNAHRPSTGASRFIGRLRPGATVDQLRSQVHALWPSLLDAVLPASPARAQTVTETSANAEAIPGGFSTLRRLYTTLLQRLAALAGVLLLLVCINVGGLLLTRTMSRAHEFAAMRALGASALRIARPVALEALLLAVAAALIGAPLAYAASAAFAGLLPSGNLPWTVELTPDPAVLLAIVLVSMVSALLVAVLPCTLAIRNQALLRSDRSVSRGGSRLAKSMLMAQVAVTLVILFGTGLIVRSFETLRHLERGYDSERLLSLRLSSNPAGYAGMDAVAYYRSLIDRVREIPGVEAAGLARYFGTLNASTFNQPVGFAAAETTTEGMVEYISPGFFAAAGVPLRAGRDVSWTDTPSGIKVAVVSESLARALSPTGDVVGRVIRHGTTPATERLQIIGVAGNLSMGNVRNAEPRMIYLPSAQFDQTAFATLHIRTAVAPLQLAHAATQAVAALGREHVRSVHAHDILFANSMVAERMGSIVSSAAASLALVVSCIGVFALLMHSVQRRTREIGIRVAVGASPRQVSTAIVREAVILTAGGISLGIPGALAAASVVESLLYGVGATDVPTLAASAAVLLVVAAAAAIVPTRRAARVDPVVALRAD